MAKRILAIGHDAYRAGAQIVFLNTLRWLRTNYDADISLLLMADGELLDEYSRVLPTRALHSLLPPGSRLGSLRARVKYRSARQAVRLGPGSVDLVYANTAAAADFATDRASEADCPLVVHVHELETSIRRFARQFGQARRRVDAFIAVSQAVKSNLVQNFEIDPATIQCISPGISLPQPGSSGRDHGALRGRLDIPDGAFVVGGCGTADWRKGPDIFLLVAKAVSRKSRGPIHFVWVGGDPDGLRMMQYDVERLGLERTVHVVGHQSDPLAYFALFDIFLLTSREDPFPLVCLEAAALSCPVICFDAAGGMPEFVADDAGRVVPYLDVEAAAAAVLELAESPPERSRLGQRAATKAVERCSIDVVGPQIAAVLDRCLGIPRHQESPGQQTQRVTA